MTDPDRPGAPGAWREVGDRVWVAVAEPAAVNLGLVAGTESCVVVDCGSSPAQGRALREAVTAVTDRPIAAVVVTHAHYDHAFGLAGFGGIPGLAHESVGAWLRGPEAAALAGGLGFDAADLLRPSRPLAVAAALDLGGRRVEVAHLGRGHTAGDLLVVVPDADLVFAGDLVESAGAPWFGADSFPAEWATTLDGLVGLMTDATRAVPGHGEPVDRAFVFEARGRVAAVAGEIRRLASAGVPVEEALGRGEWAYPEEHVAEGVRAGYAELGEVRAAPASRQLPLV